MAGIKHILVIRFSAMGDVAMTVPVIKALLAQNPEVQVTYISRPAFAAFFALIPRLNYISIDLEKEYNGFGGILKLFKELKTKKYDALADLHNNLRSKILRRLFRLSGLMYAYIDKGRNEKKQLTRFPGKVLKPLKLTTERYADVFRRLGLQLVLEHRLIKQPGELAKEIIAITGEKTRQWMGIAPFAKHKGKIYPLERTEEVIYMLSDRNVTIFLFGGSLFEEEICREWEARYKNVHSLVNRITMEQELTLISQLDVMLSMDSAGMHLASLEGVPVVSVWGATHHYAGFLGYGQSESNIVADDIECRPCSVYGDKPCFRKDYACLYNIDPLMIIKALNKFID
ncbi:MAG: glycosyltransferase family 9 protein [Bacteroidota bacterium]|nr:glycosyltransferase family 9 protein [Bacteroidota bacterium]